MCKDGQGPPRDDSLISEPSRPRPAPSPMLLRNVVILACAIDAADKQLLPATFKAMDEAMHLGPAGLATLNFAQCLAFSLALPVWGSLMRYRTAQELMVYGCVIWGVGTCLLAATSWWEMQVFLRMLVGFALASVNPLGQAIICDVVPESERGHAFGLLQAVQAVLCMAVSFGATALSSREFLGIAGWRWAYVIIAFFSLLVGALLHGIGGGSAPPVASSKSWFEEQRRALRAVGSKPTFYLMVAQGVTGGVPWNAFAFLTFFYQLSGYSDVQVAQIALFGGFGGIIGGLLGGQLGDWTSAPNRLPTYGRCLVAQASVVLGTGCFLWMIHIPYGPGSFAMVVAAYFSFQATATWTCAAALRPMCGDLFKSSQDRAQVLALWIALEGIVSSFCGAPLASALSYAFGYRLDSSGTSIPTDAAARAEDVDALREALVGVSISPWALCALAWFPMYVTYPRDKVAAEDQKASAYLSVVQDDGLLH